MHKPSRAQVPFATAALLAGLALVLARVCSGAGPGPASVAAAPAPAATNAPEVIAVAPPPFSEGIFPCSACHDPSNEVDTTPRQLKDAHEDIVLHHDEGNRWCLDCHDAKDRDHLHLASGRKIEFAESYRLCGQCHGPTLRAWKAGEHGKRTGSWSGRKEYLLCVSCHNPHSPRFKPLKPLPPPVRPEDLR